MTKFTRRSISRTGALGLTSLIAAPALAQSGKLRWRMVTSWPKRLPGPGMSAERVAERIGALSGGRLEIAVSAAGEVVPALEVLDAVGSGVAEMGHTAAFYWQGKAPAAAFFTTVPFGLLPNEHVAWIEAGGGQALWDELYVPFGVKPFMAGNTGTCMGGWFRREVKSRDDVRGLKIRSLGLGGEVYRRLGAIPQTTAPGEILVALKAWQALDGELQTVVAHACADEASFALAEMERLNVEALTALTTQHNVQLATFPADLIAAGRAQAKDVLGELAGKSAGAAKVHASYTAFRDKVVSWSRISTEAVLRAREG